MTRDAMVTAIRERMAGGQTAAQARQGYILDQRRWVRRLIASLRDAPAAPACDVEQEPRP